MKVPGITKRSIIYFAGCFALICFTYMPALYGTFIFDDYPVFADNKLIENASWTWAYWKDVVLWSNSNLHRPLAMLSLALNFALGSSAWGFKATNLAIHLANAWLLFLLARRLLTIAWLRYAEQAAPDQPSHIAAWALVVTLAWAVHPLQVSSVMYVVQRMELLGFTFTLVGLLSYVKARDNQMRHARAWPWLVITALSAVVGYTAKETAILIPAYTLILEFTLFRFKAHSIGASRGWKLFYASGCVAAVAVLVLYGLPHYATPAAFSGRSFSAWERTLTQLRALCLYLGWIVFPLPGHMHFYYDGYAASKGWLEPVSTLVGGCFLLALVVAALALRRRRPLFAVGILWFFVAHALTSAPLPLELVFEHRNYPAIFGIVLAIADILWLVTRSAHPKLPQILGIISIAALCFFAVIRAATWGNPLQLALTLAEDNPSSSRAGYDLATRYMMMSGGDPASPMYARAVSELERSSALPNASTLPDQALLLMASGGGVKLDPTWWDHFLSKLKTRPVGPEERNSLARLGRVRVDEGNQGIDARKLAMAYEIVLDRAPSSELYVQYADLESLVLHDQPKADQALRQAVALNRATPRYAVLLANYFVQRDRPHEALVVLTEATRLTPALDKDKDLIKLKAEASSKTTL
ncbi:tetratricopeptide repeat protein [Dyella sp. KRB-257]|uniref:tetratricopeptide repeat protein n=1 Tax=Dyella sp. KRB-257 TaxID=3400915 RepID=UPI00086D7A00|nr:MAG: hypothetical protein ABT16_00515 [Rhodanobacter sp. SCN 65-17]